MAEDKKEIKDTSVTPKRPSPLKPFIRGYPLGPFKK